MGAAWTQSDAIRLCGEVEAICPAFGCHVALTGGTLYKIGPRKDVDILFYRIRHVAEIDREGLFRKLKIIGLSLVSDHGWCCKAIYRGKAVDCFFPDDEGEYVGADDRFSDADEEIAF